MRTLSGRYDATEVSQVITLALTNDQAEVLKRVLNRVVADHVVYSQFISADEADCALKLRDQTFTALCPDPNQKYDMWRNGVLAAYKAFGFLGICRMIIDAAEQAPATGFNADTSAFWRITKAGVSRARQAYIDAMVSNEKP